MDMVRQEVMGDEGSYRGRGEMEELERQEKTRLGVKKEEVWCRLQ